MNQLIEKETNEKNLANLKKQKKNLEDLEGGNLKYLITKRDYSLLPKKVRTNSVSNSPIDRAPSDGDSSNPGPKPD